MDIETIRAAEAIVLTELRRARKHQSLAAETALREVSRRLVELRTSTARQSSRPPQAASYQALATAMVAGVRARLAAHHAVPAGAQ
jgi:hypothetical protein